MFQKRTTGFIAALTTAFCLTALPATSFAQDKAPAAQAQPSSLKDMSLADIRFETKAKLSDTRQWVKDTKIEQNVEYFIGDLEKATDRLQDKVAPAGQSMKAFVKGNTPGKSLVAKTEKSVTFFGLMLILAFAFVVFLMSVSGPASRLGGRH